MTEKPLLRIEGLTKRFGATLALDEVELTVRASQVHAILGENGAGKSTLMNLLYGMLSPDAGRILWRGKDVILRSPARALDLGIGMVHQHFMLVPALSVWENIWLAHPDRPVLRLAAGEARRVTEDLAQRYRLDLDPDARVEDLAVGALQRIEIAKALARRVSLLVLDEPTAVLTPGEIRSLFEVIRELRAAGCAVLFISHKLDEVLQISDRITVLRGGRVVESCATRDADAADLTRKILGTKARTSAGEGPPAPVGRAGEVCEVLLEVKNLASTAGRIALRNVSFEVAAGEILGVTGVDGNGQDELVALLAGLDCPDSGRIRLRGEDVSALSVRARWQRGLSVLPGDRAREGLALDVPLWENLALREYGARWARRRGAVDPAAHVRRAEELLARFDVRGASVNAPARSLSGGNQQKLLLARELASDPSVLVLLNPTRGLDLAAIRALTETLERLRAQGHAVVLFSTELEDVLALASRWAVMRRGELREADRPDPELLGSMMLGAV